MLKEGQVRITDNKQFEHATVFVVTYVSGEDAYFIDTEGLVYPGIKCRQIIEDTSTVLAEYPTWIDAVNSKEFNKGKPKRKGE